MRLINWFLSLFQGSGESETTALDLFLHGATIPWISVELNPGIGGPVLLEQQRLIESEIRDYIFELSDMIAELRQELAEG